MNLKRQGNRDEREKKREGGEGERGERGRLQVEEIDLKATRRRIINKFEQENSEVVPQPVEGTKE